MSLRRLVGLHNTLQSLAGRCIAAQAAHASEPSATLLAAPTALRLAAASLTSDHHFPRKRSFAAEAAEEVVEATELTLTDAAVEVRAGFTRPARHCLGVLHDAAVCPLVLPQGTGTGCFVLVGYDFMPFHYSSLLLERMHRLHGTLHAWFSTWRFQQVPSLESLMSFRPPDASSDTCQA